MWGKKKKKDKCPDAERAREGAAEALREAEEQWERVHEVTKSLQHVRRRNNFAEAVERVIRGTA